MSESHERGAHPVAGRGTGGHAGPAARQRDRPRHVAGDGEVFAAFRDDRALRVAVLRTAGERFFCAGWDLKAAAAGDAVDGDYGVGGFGGIQELPGLNKPVIALVEGMAVGGGFELALSCDLIYAADTASFALPEINAGTLADAATLRLPTRMPHHIAMELLLTGRWMDAAEAHRWGLVNEVHPPAHLPSACWRSRAGWPRGRRWCSRRSRRCSARASA